jgi:hypothetical protein
MQNIIISRKIIFLLLTILIGIIFLYPTLDFQLNLAQGDHGRDLYAFERTLHGDKIYQDYWWVYGPLMPVYYSLFYKFLGVNIVSILFAKSLLILAGVALIFLILALFSSPTFALIGASWFLLFHDDFFFTYNHLGGIIMILAVSYCTFLYIKEQKLKHLFWGLFFIFLLGLVKMNFALTSLISFTLTAFFTSKNFQKRLPKKFLISAFLILPLTVGVIYYFLLNGLMVNEIRQCFPYLGGDQPHHATPTQALSMLAAVIYRNILASPVNILLAFLTILSSGITAYFLANNKTDLEIRSRILLAIGYLLFSYVLNLHEFLVSGVTYRSYWATPFAIVLIFLLIGWAAARLTSNIRGIIIFFFCAIILFQVNHHNQTISKGKIASQYLILERGKIFVGNSPAWVKTVSETTQYLQNNLKKDETFFALPYETLYHYLTARKSPTRQLIIFEHIKIPQEQERKIIAELEKNRVNWILLSNRAKAKETGLGTLGVTHCPLIAEYIEKNFEMTAQFGDWIHEPGWAWNHGTRILKRKN